MIGLMTRDVEATVAPCVESQHAPSAPKTSLVERLRKPISASVAVATFAAIWAAEPTRSVYGRVLETGASYLLVCAAVLGRLWCGLYIAGRKNAELCAAGPYSICRNPLYLFSSLGLAGVVLATHRPGIAAGAWVLFWIFHLFVIRGEESRLHCRFGADFAQYCSRVPRLGLKLSAYTSPPTILVTTRPLLRGFADVSWFFVTWLVVHAATSVT